MSAVTLKLPSDKEIRGFNLACLQAQKVQHERQIRTFQKFLEDEQMRLVIATNIIERKKVLGD